MSAISRPDRRPDGPIEDAPAADARRDRAQRGTYKAQVFKILDRDKTVVEFNSRWLDARRRRLIQLAARYNVAQMLERREFRQRFESASRSPCTSSCIRSRRRYDSVVAEADVELGGTDQLFNLNVGRDIMPATG